MGGSAVRSHDWPKKGRASSVRQTLSCLLSFQGYLSILEAVRLLHRYHRNRWEQRQTKPLESELLRAHLQVQYLSEVTNKPPGDWSRKPSKSNTKKEGWQEGCGRSVGRSSVLVGGFPRQSGEHRIACTRTQFSQIRPGHPVEVVSKSRKHRFFFSLSERPKLRRLLVNQNNKGFFQKTHWRSSGLVQDSLVTW